MRAFPTAPGTALLTVDQALSEVLQRVTPLGTESVALHEAFGRVLREDIIASADVPPVDNSGMDGYALRSADTAGAPVRLRVIGDVPAGRPASHRVEEGTAVRIMTGASVPDGADAIAQVEFTDGGTDLVTIHRAVEKGANVRRRGEDMRAGDAVLRSGTLLGAPDVAVAATARQATLTVGRRPSMTILSTGDELAGVGETTAPDRIVDSNSYALAGLAAAAGATARRGAIVRDDREVTIAAIESALQSDFVVTTGGVSVGAYDFVKEALEALGAQTHFWRVAMKPGKPVLFATVRDRLFFGLPGNPVSAMLSFILFVAPAIRTALGQTSEITAPIVRVRTRAALKGAEDRRAYQRVRVVARDGELFAEPMRAQGSHIATSMVGANGLAIVEAGTTIVETGEVVPVMVIGPILSSLATLPRNSQC